MTEEHPTFRYPREELERAAEDMQRGLAEPATKADLIGVVHAVQREIDQLSAGCMMMARRAR